MDGYVIFYEDKNDPDHSTYKIELSSKYGPTEHVTQLILRMLIAQGYKGVHAYLNRTYAENVRILSTIPPDPED